MRERENLWWIPESQQHALTGIFKKTEEGHYSKILWGNIKPNDTNSNQQLQQVDNNPKASE